MSNFEKRAYFRRFPGFIKDDFLEAIEASPSRRTSRNLSGHPAQEVFQEVPMESVERRALARAVQIFGSPESLAREMDVSADRLEYWLDGLLPIPPEAFARIVDVLLQANLLEVKRDCAKARLVRSEDEPRASAARGERSKT